MKFELTGVELEKYQAWYDSHECDFRKGRTPKFNEDGYPKGGAIGGITSFTFTPTGLGPICVVKCACGHEENVTDFDSW